jgi:thymidylate kinase
MIRTLRTTVPPEFSVLLGPDYSGKSSALEALSLAGWQSISCDDSVVQPVFGDLRKGFVRHVLPGIGEAYSPDFVFTLLQASVVYLRDQVVRAAPNRPVIVDSYYYKILAKCVLTGLVKEDMFAWWRSFPPPRRVIYLDVDPETAWRRSDEGARLNPFEYYGTTPTLAGFRHFQTDLRRLMVREVGTVPVTVLDAPESVEQVAHAIRQIMGSDDAAELTA